jgi:hypothetical protein
MCYTRDEVTTMQSPLIPRFGLGLRPVHALDKLPPRTPTAVDELAALLASVPLFRGPAEWHEDADGLIHVCDAHGAEVVMSRNAAAAFGLNVEV